MQLIVYKPISKNIIYTYLQGNCSDIGWEQ